jgi:hypothetical protein
MDISITLTDDQIALLTQYNSTLAKPFVDVPTLAASLAVKGITASCRQSLATQVLKLDDSALATIAMAIPAKATPAAPANV